MDSEGEDSPVSHVFSLIPAFLINNLSGLIMNDLGKMLVVGGVFMTVVGVVLWSGVGKGWLGRLPGDINYTRGDFSVHFPVVTCLIVSATLTLLMWLFRK